MEEFQTARVVLQAGFEHPTGLGEQAGRPKSTGSADHGPWVLWLQLAGFRVGGGSQEEAPQPFLSPTLGEFRLKLRPAVFPVPGGSV